MMIKRLFIIGLILFSLMGCVSTPELSSEAEIQPKQEPTEVTSTSQPVAKIEESSETESKQTYTSETAITESGNISYLQHFLDTTATDSYSYSIDEYYYEYIAVCGNLRYNYNLNFLSSYWETMDLEDIPDVIWFKDSNEIISYCGVTYKRDLLKFLKSPNYDPKMRGELQKVYTKINISDLDSNSLIRKVFFSVSPVEIIEKYKTKEPLRIDTANVVFKYGDKFRESNLTLYFKNEDASVTKLLIDKHTEIPIAVYTYSSNGALQEKIDYSSFSSPIECRTEQELNLTNAVFMTGKQARDYNNFVDPAYKLDCFEPKLTASLK